MKKISQFIMLIVCLHVFSQETSSNQNISVEKSLFGIQTGLLGVWINNESRLSNQWALRSEAGLDYAFNSNYITGATHVFAPVINAEPRYYYNLLTRAEKGKSIAHNSANFLTLGIHYVPNWFVISNQRNVSVIPSISFIPKWGIRRSLENGFTYEAGIGLGWRHYFTNYGTTNEATLDLHVRIGYTF